MTAQNWGKPTAQALEDMILDRLAPLASAYVSAPRHTGSGISDLKVAGWYSFAAGPNIYKILCVGATVSPCDFAVYKNGTLIPGLDGINFDTADNPQGSMLYDDDSGDLIDTGIRVSAPGNDGMGGGYTVGDYWEITAGGGPLKQIVAVNHRLDSPEDAMQALADLGLSAPVGMLSLADEQEGDDGEKAADCRTIDAGFSGRFAVVFPSVHSSDNRRMDYWILDAWKMLMARWLPPSGAYPEKPRTFFVNRFPLTPSADEDDADMKRVGWGNHQVILGGSTRDWVGASGIARVFDFTIRFQSTPMDL